MEEAVRNANSNDPHHTPKSGGGRLAACAALPMVLVFHAGGGTAP